MAKKKRASTKKNNELGFGSGGGDGKGAKVYKSIMNADGVPLTRQMMNKKMPTKKGMF